MWLNDTPVLPFLVKLPGKVPWSVKELVCLPVDISPKIATVVHS